MTEYCRHGLRERNQHGWDVVDGLAVCRACGLPTAQSAQLRAGRQPVSGFESPADRQQRESRPILVVTTNDVANHRIEQVHGDVFGLVVRVRNVFANLGASVRSVVGGEVAGYTKLLADSRNEARARLIDEARRVGANAVVAMRFDCNEIGDIMSEVAAYGTAVTIAPLPPDTP